MPPLSYHILEIIIYDAVEEHGEMLSVMTLTLLLCYGKTKLRSPC